MNIFGNALKYTQKGSIIVELALDPLNNDLMEDAERMLEIKVTDTGRGISSEYIRTNLYNRGYTNPYICSEVSDLLKLSVKKTY